MFCIIKGLVEKGEKNSRWLVSHGDKYFTTLIPNKDCPSVGETLDFTDDKLEPAMSKHLRKEVFVVRILKQKEGGPKNSRWFVEFNGKSYSCLLSNELEVLPEAFLPVTKDNLTEE